MLEQSEDVEDWWRQKRPKLFVLESGILEIQAKNMVLRLSKKYDSKKIIF